MQSIMNAEEPKRLSRRAKRAIAAVGAISALVAGFFANRYIDRKAEEDFRSDIAMYFALPSFSGHDFRRQAIGNNPEFGLYDIDEGKLYFSPANERAISRVTAAPERAHILSDEEKFPLFGGTHGPFFSIPVADLKVDRNKTITTDFGKVKYEVTLQEMSDFISDRIACGGYSIITGESSDGRKLKFLNHQFNTTKRGDFSLSRLAEQIIAGSKSHEQMAQKLLDFVTYEIKYDGIDRLDGSQKIKRPNEVLLSREADCSGKSVLYASLLEQVGIDYQIMYFFPDHGANHMTVAVKGNFPDYNSLYFDVVGDRYYIAETTVPGFRIGLTRLFDEDMLSGGQRYTQQACYKQGFLRRLARGFSSNSDIMNIDSGKPLRIVE